MTRQELGIELVIGFPAGVAILYVIIGKWRTWRAIRKQQAQRMSYRRIDLPR